MAFRDETEGSNMPDVPWPVSGLTQAHLPKGTSSPGCWEPVPRAVPKWAGINTIAVSQ